MYVLSITLASMSRKKKCVCVWEREGETENDRGKIQKKRNDQKPDAQWMQAKQQAAAEENASDEAAAAAAAARTLLCYCQVFFIVRPSEHHPFLLGGMSSSVC